MDRQHPLDVIREGIDEHEKNLRRLLGAEAALTGRRRRVAIVADKRSRAARATTNGRNT